MVEGVGQVPVELVHELQGAAEAITGEQQLPRGSGEKLVEIQGGVVVGGVAKAEAAREKEFARAQEHFEHARRARYPEDLLEEEEIADHVTGDLGVGKDKAGDALGLVGSEDAGNGAAGVVGDEGHGRQFEGVNEGGKQLKISKQRAMIKSLLAKALKGDTRAATVLLKLLIDAERATTKNAVAEALSENDQAILASFAERVLAKSKKSAQEKVHDV